MGYHKVGNPHTNVPAITLPLYCLSTQSFNPAKFGWIPIVLPVNPVSAITLNMAMLCDEGIDWVAVIFTASQT